MVTAVNAGGVGMSAKRAIGHDVIDHSGHKIGELEDLVMDANQWCARFAIVDSGGFLGMGERHHIVPAQGLRWLPDTNQLAIDFDNDLLANAPLLDRNHPPDWNNESWTKTVHDYFGMSYGGSQGQMGRQSADYDAQQQAGYPRETGPGYTGPAEGQDYPTGEGRGSSGNRNEPY